MQNIVESKINKAKQLRYKKPIVRNLNLDFIKDTLCDIQEACQLPRPTVKALEVGACNCPVV